MSYGVENIELKCKTKNGISCQILQKKSSCMNNQDPYFFLYKKRGNAFLEQISMVVDLTRGKGKANSITRKKKKKPPPGFPRPGFLSQNKFLSRAFRI